MSFLAMEWARTAPVANPAERAILFELAYRASDDGTDAFPSKKRLAESAVCHPKTVQTHLSNLRKRGVIAGGNQAAAAYLPEHSRPTVYNLQIPAEWYSPEVLAKLNEDRKDRGLGPLNSKNRPQLGPADKRSHPSKGTKRPKDDESYPQGDHPKGGEQNAPGEHNAPGEQGFPEGGAFCSEGGEHFAPQTRPFNPSSKPVLKDSPASGDAPSETDLFGNSIPTGSKPGKPDPSERFGEFWEEVPRKEGRKEALTAWERSIKAGTEPDTIIEGMRRYALLVQAEQRERKFIKTPAAWINARKWEDEFPHLNGSQEGQTAQRQDGHQPFRGYSDAAYEPRENSVWSIA